MSKRTLLIVALAAALGCSPPKTSAPSARPENPPSLARTAPAPAATFGTGPPPTVHGLRITPVAAPPGLFAPPASWLRVTRPDHRSQLVAVFRPPRHGRHPVIVYLHGSSGLESNELAWSAQLAQRGFIVVAGCYLDQPTGPPYWVRCPDLPATEPTDVGTVGPAYDAILSTARALPDAEPGALGIIGVSYGAIVALTLPRAGLRAIVADSGAGKAGAAPVSAPVLMLGMQVDVHEPHIALVGFELALRRAYMPVDSHYYPGVGHVVTLTVPGGVAANATARAVAFFRRYVH